MKTNCYTSYIMANTPYRTEQFEGQQYLVVPVIALVEGVHCGSAGAYYYPASEIAHFAETWNGRDVPVFHPQEDGRLVSVNDPQIIEEWSVGRTFNFHADNGKLKGEIWINLVKARQKAPEVLNMIYAGDRLEVSTGLFSDEERNPGNWNGEAYDVIARNIRPDHLALLPGGRGACSWEDGCGVRANKEGGIMEINEEVKDLADRIMDEPDRKKSRTMLNRLKGLFKSKIIPQFLDNEVSFEDTRIALQRIVDGMDNGIWMHYVRKVYDDYFVYVAEPNPESPQNLSTKLFSQKYSVDDNGVVDLAEDDPVEVIEKPVEFVPKNNEEGGNKMADDKTDKKPCCEEAVQGLIENEATDFAEEDREWLMGLSEDQLKKVTPKAEKPSPVAQAVSDAAQAAIPGIPVKGDEPKTNEELDRMKAEVISGILANDKTFTEDELKAMEGSVLIKMAERLRLADPVTPADFTGNAGAQQTQNSEYKVEPLELPKMDFGVEKDK